MEIFNFSSGIGKSNIDKLFDEQDICNIFILTDKNNPNIVKVATTSKCPKDYIIELIREGTGEQYKLYTFETGFKCSKDTKLRKSIVDYLIEGEKDLYQLQPNVVHALIRSYQDNLYSTTATYIITDIIESELEAGIITRFNEDDENLSSHLLSWGVEEDVIIDNFVIDTATYQVSMTLSADKDTLNRLTLATIEYEHEEEKYIVSRPMTAMQYEEFLEFKYELLDGKD